MDVHAYWQAVLEQNREKLADFFWEDANVCWHNTNECFTVSEFIRANCDYPGKWGGNVERVEKLGDTVITVTHVCNKERTVSCHAVTFLRLQARKIRRADEYWSDDGKPPQWRQDLHIGSPIGEC